MIYDKFNYLQPPPAPRIRSKMDSLFFMPDSFKASGAKEKVAPSGDALPVPQSQVQESKKLVEKEPEVQVEIENVERPVDLYKVLLSLLAPFFSNFLNIW